MPLDSVADIESVSEPAAQNSAESAIGTPLLPYGSAVGYTTSSEAHEFLRRLVSSAYGTITGHVEIGTTYKQNPIYMHCLGRCPSKLDSSMNAPVRRPSIEDVPAARGVHELLINALHHAREPLTLAALLLFARRQVEAVRAGVPEAQALWSTRAAWLLPITNPDGYDFNSELLVKGRHSEARQRKNRHVVGSKTCGAGKETSMGVDINRNYLQFFDRGDPRYDTDSDWKEDCGEVYRGERAFSEAETRAIRDFLEARFEIG